MEKKIYVYENWSSETPQKLGTLFIDSIRGGEYSSFQFDPKFLTDACTSQMLVLDPDLSLVTESPKVQSTKASAGQKNLS